MRKHLAALTGEQATLYRALGRVALGLADLSPPQRSEMENLLGESTAGLPSPSPPSLRSGQAPGERGQG